MSPSEAIRLAALQVVFDSHRKKPKEPDPEYFLRRVFRAYSKKFFTPLHEVEELPLDDVLQHFWEEHFEEVGEDVGGRPGSGMERLEEVRREVLLDPEVRKELQRQEDESEVFTFEVGQEQVKADEENAKQSTTDKLVAAAEALRGLSHQPLPFGRNTTKEASLDMSPATKKAMPENLKIEFVDDLDLDADSFGLFDDKPKKP